MVRFADVVHHSVVAWNSTLSSLNAPASDAPSPEEPIELIGVHLRLTGIIGLHRFGRLSDLINSSIGAIRIHDARLLQPNGEPTEIALPNLMVDQDEISFIAQRDQQPRRVGAQPGLGGTDGAPGASGRTARRFVMFMPGHAVWGNVFLFGETDLPTFMDTSDPRFVAVTDARVQSLSDRGVIHDFPFLLINRSLMIAASEVEEGEGAENDPAVVEAVTEA